MQHDYEGGSRVISRMGIVILLLAMMGLVTRAAADISSVYDDAGWLRALINSVTIPPYMLTDTAGLLLSGAKNIGGAGIDTLTNVENLKDSNYYDTLTGNAGSNHIIGGLGKDTITGSSGADCSSSR